MSSFSEQHLLTDRLIELQRTVERLTSHVNHLQQQLVTIQSPRRRETPVVSLWQRFIRPTGQRSRAIRENRRIHHAISA